MKPGVELDKLVAEKVFGRKVVKTVWGKDKQYSCYSLGAPEWDWIRDEGDTLMNPVPEYSTDIKAAWEVMAKFPEGANLVRRYENGEGWVCELTRDGERYVAEHGNTAEHAICLAALEAIKG